MRVDVRRDGTWLHGFLPGFEGILKSIIGNSHFNILKYNLMILGHDSNCYIEWQY